MSASMPPNGEVSMHLDSMCQHFLDYCRLEKQLSPLTITAYTQDLREFGTFACGLRDVSGDDLIRYVAHLRSTRNLAAATVKRRLACLRAMFNWMVRQHILAR